jgi:hypothetical protein
MPGAWASIQKIATICISSALCGANGGRSYAAELTGLAVDHKPS